MGSPQKQAKRAKRAKAKAKEARTTRNSVSKYTTTEVVELSPKTYALFADMKEAEGRSRVEMLTLLMADPAITAGEDPAAAQRVLLAYYYDWKQQFPASGWWYDAEFLVDYTEAARRAGREDLVESWSADLPDTA